MLSSLKTSKSFDSGVTDAKWTSTENVLIGTAEHILNQFAQNPSLQKGEFVLICE
jgi:hypothetical protein